MNLQLAQNLVDFAEHGINILDIVPNGEIYWVLVEYSWNDPKLQGKLHWSKIALPVSCDKGALDLSIVSLICETRKLLEA